jgi:HEAT repeat protein
MILRAMRKRPEDRYATVDEMLEKLLAIESALGLGTRIEPGGAAPAHTPSGARPSAATSAAMSTVAKIGAVAAVLLAASAVAFVLLRNKEEPPSPGAAIATTSVQGPGTPAVTPTSELAALIAKGRLDEAKQIARDRLSAELASDPAAQGNAVAAMALARSPRLAPLLYTGLDGPPQARREAASALRDMGLAEAAPRLRAALEASGTQLKVEIAGCLLALGDDSAKAILEQALKGDPGAKLAAAEALALAGRGDTAGVRPILDSVARDTPPGRDRWRRAMHALAKLGAAEARPALEKELAVADGERAVAAAGILASLGEPKAIAYLGRVAEDPEFSARAEAALHLARAGDKAALDFATQGLAGSDPDQRRYAIAVTAALAGAGGSVHLPAIATLGEDPDPRVRVTAWAALLAFD